MARGDGVARVKHAPPPPKKIPEGREPGDARGASWPWIIGGTAFVVGCAVYAGVTQAGKIELAGGDGKKWLTDISGPVAGLVVLIVAGLVVKVLNNSGRTMRGQGVLGSNQVALDARLASIGERLDKLEKPVALPAEQVKPAIVEELRKMREALDVNSARVGRLGAQITGGHPVVQPRTTGPVIRPGTPLASPAPEPPRTPGLRPRASDPAVQDPFDKSQPWHSGTTTEQPSVDPPAGSYGDDDSGRWEERFRRPRFP